MSLERGLSRQVSPRIRARGREYFEHGAVRLVGGSAREVRARVRGGGVYDVSLRRTGAVLEAMCSCPSYERDLAACKHVWATVLAADAGGHFAGGSAAVTALTVPDEMLVLPGDDLEQDDADDVEPEVGRGGAHGYGHPQLGAGWSPPAIPRARSPFQPERRPVPGWRELLSSLHRSPEQVPGPREEPWPLEKEILYTIDVAQTLAQSRLALDALARSRKQNGDWSKPQPARVSAAGLRSLPDPADREILGILCGAQSAPYVYPGYADYGDQRPLTFRLLPPLTELIVPLVCRTGRCALRGPEADGPLRPLAWDEGPAWELWLETRPDEAGKHYVLRGALRRGPERMDLSAPVLLFAGGLVFTTERAARLEDFGAFAWLTLLRERPEIRVPLGEAERLLEEILRSPHLPRLDLPPELSVEEVRVSPRPRLRLSSQEKGGWEPERLTAELSFDYGGPVLSEHDSGGGVFDAPARRRILRDRDAERAAAARLAALGCRLLYASYDYDRGRVRQVTPRHVPRLVRTLLEEGWYVEAEGKLYRRPGAINVSVTSGIDWFDLEGTVEYGEQTATLPALLAALRRGETLVQLGDGTFGMLPEEWLRKYGPIGALGAPAGEALRFGRSQVGLLDALLAALPEASSDAAFAAARAEIRRFTGVEPADPPPSFAGTLRPYQREGLGWIRFLERFRFGGCLADDMGLGKTVQALALLETRRSLRAAGGATEAPRPALVVAPRSLIFNWKAEAARFTPELRVLDHTGTGRSCSPAAFDAYDLVLTTYGTLRRDAAYLRDVRFAWVILDEAQAIKNAASASAKAARLLQADHRLALSGTPIENHLGELWSLFEFLNPGMLGTASVFRLMTGGSPRTLADDSRELLARALRPFLLRRTKEQVAKDLPARTEQTLMAELDKPQRRLYDELRDHYRQALHKRIEREGFARAKIQVLEALLRLRQAACHPGLIDRARATEPSAKLDALLPTLEEVIAEGHKALVFSQFTSFLAIVRSRLDAARVPYEYLDGRTRDRGPRVERFQNDPDCRLFLISLKAGGLGLNLTAAGYVFLLDPWWNPAVEMQAIDRTHRIGQTQQVFAYRLIARDTVEEKVLELQRRKRDLARAILTDENSLIRALSREDLELLLS
jgi:superfamily II DNA or RNA helicase